MIFSTMIAATDLPKPISVEQMQQIGCISTLAIIAGEQGRNPVSAQFAFISHYPDLRAQGKKWAGIAGDRITFETGQPPEVIGFAITQSVADTRKLASAAPNLNQFYTQKLNACWPMVQHDLNAAKDAAQDAAKDDPAPSAQETAIIAADMNDSYRAQYCATLISAEAKHNIGENGFGSEDAQYLAGVTNALKQLSAKLGPPPPPVARKTVSADELSAQLANEPSKEQEIKRCVLLGEAYGATLQPQSAKP